MSDVEDRFVGLPTSVPVALRRPRRHPDSWFPRHRLCRSASDPQRSSDRTKELPHFLDCGLILLEAQCGLLMYRFVQFGINPAPWGAKAP